MCNTTIVGRATVIYRGEPPQNFIPNITIIGRKNETKVSAFPFFWSGSVFSLMHYCRNTARAPSLPNKIHEGPQRHRQMPSPGVVEKKTTRWRAKGIQ